MSKSIMQEDRRCLICGTPYGLHRHHVFHGTANRKQSEKYGCWVWLCSRHHNGSANSVHLNAQMDQRLKMTVQAKFEETHTREEFMQIFGKSWL